MVFFIRCSLRRLGTATKLTKRPARASSQYYLTVQPSALASAAIGSHGLSRALFLVELVAATAPVSATESLGERIGICTRITCVAVRTNAQYVCGQHRPMGIRFHNGEVSVTPCL